MAQYNPQVDLIFKKIFGVEENKDLLISLINSIVSEADQVKDVTLKNPYNHQNFLNDKLSILDIKAQGHNGKLYNIEIQITDEKNYEKRALYYWGKMYSEQLKAKGVYQDLQKAIGIHILNFECLPEHLSKDRYHNVFHIKEKELGFPFFRDLELHTIELSKFAHSLTASDDTTEMQAFKKKVHQSLDWWIGFLTRHDLIQQMNEVKPDVQKAMDVLEYMHLSDEERLAYDDREKYLLLINDALEKQFEEGVEQGKIEGKVEGLIEGEQKAKREVALKMIRKGLDDESIIELSGLTQSELDDIKG